MACYDAVKIFKNKPEKKFRTGRRAPGAPPLGIQRDSMVRNYYLYCQLGGWFTEFKVETTKRKDEKKYVPYKKQAKEKNQHLYILFCFCLFLRWEWVDTGYMICVLHSDK